MTTPSEKSQETDDRYNETGNTDSRQKPTTQPCLLVSKPTIYRIYFPDMIRPERAQRGILSLPPVSYMYRVLPSNENKSCQFTTPRNETKAADIEEKPASSFQPHTGAWTPSPLFEAHAPLPLPHAKPPELESLGFGSPAEADADVLEAEEAERSLPDKAASFGVKPKPSGDGKGVVERLFRAGLVAEPEPAC